MRASRTDTSVLLPDFQRLVSSVIIPLARYPSQIQRNSASGCDDRPPAVLKVKVEIIAATLGVAPSLTQPIRKVELGSRQLSHCPKFPWDAARGWVGGWESQAACSASSSGQSSIRVAT